MMNDAVDAYEQARKSAQKYVSAKEMAHEDPYLPVLDVLLKDAHSAGELRVGYEDILLKDIVGTKTKGRSESFAGNFMPLLPLDSEFGQKWVSLYASQLEEGLRDPIKVYEYYHKYYVQEGNKRVSVMKFLDAPLISALVIRVLPAKDDSEESQAYYEYLDFVQDSGLDFLTFSKPGSYKRLERIIRISEENPWDEIKAENLKEVFTRFSRIFAKASGKRLKISLPDAFLMYLEYFGLDDPAEKNQKEMEKEVEKIWPELEAYPNQPEVTLVTEKDSLTTRKPLLSLRFEPLHVAFIHSRDSSTSSWTKKHEEAQEYISNLLYTDITAKNYFGADGREKEMEIMEQAIKDGAEVVFTTSPAMLRSSLKLAAKYPKVKVLNCSLNTRTGQLRTYFARIYEIQFLFGMIAGILTRTDKIGYIADYPIYGMIANINAFSLGVKMTNPKAQVYLDWSTTRKSMLSETPADIDVTFIAGEEFDPNVLSTKEYGLYDATSGKFLNLATTSYYWGAFYLKILQSILNNQWKNTGADGESINYWYGLSNGTLGFHLSANMPLQTKRLIEVMREHMSEGTFNLFSTLMEDQDHVTRNQQYQNMELDDIMNMDWLLDNITGKIPALDDFSEDAQRMIALHGISKVKESAAEEENV